MNQVLIPCVQFETLFYDEEPKKHRQHYYKRIHFIQDATTTWLKVKFKVTFTCSLTLAISRMVNVTMDEVELEEDVIVPKTTNDIYAKRLIKDKRNNKPIIFLYYYYLYAMTHSL